VNNVLGFPYIFRGALDVRATKINEEMKVAAAQALAELAREAVPDEVAAAYGGNRVFGPDYIIPAPFDPRLIERVPAAVAQAAMDSGVARKPIFDMEAYALELRARLNPTSSALAATFEAAKGAAQAGGVRRGRAGSGAARRRFLPHIGLWRTHAGGPQRAHIGGLPADRRDRPRKLPHPQQRKQPAGARDGRAAVWPLQRQGYLKRDVQRMVNNERNIFGALLVEMGEADAMVSGVTRHFNQVMSQVQLVVDPLPGQTPFGFHVFAGRAGTFLIADTTVNERPTAVQLADIAVKTAGAARRIGMEPRVAFLSYSNFGNPPGEYLGALHEAVAILDEMRPGFEYEGEMSVDVALNKDMGAVYPFARLTGPANVLIMPGLQSANIAAKLLKELGGGRVIGPVLMNMSKAVQIAPMTSGASDLVTLAALAAAGVVQ
jgi:malate dehydrogenase (oxaloacetate-decarboxylating)(NADP+)